MITRSHKPGSNITIMNTLSGNFQDENDKYHEGLVLIYKDVDTGIKYKEEYEDPPYTFYVANKNSRVDYNRLFIEKENVTPITVSHREIEKEIANITGNKKYFYNNISTGNRRENQRLHAIPEIFGSDIHIEDYYRKEFNNEYKNEPCNVTKAFLDIETDIINIAGDFPQPGEAPVNAVTLTLKDENKVFVFLLENEVNPQIQEFKQAVQNGSIISEVKSFIETSVGGHDRAVEFGIDKFDYNFLFYKVEAEINMISDIFKAINTYKPDFCLAWNMSFDIPYLIERIKVLGYNPADIICHKDFEIRYCQYYIDERQKNEFAERGDFALISSYTTYIDQMIQYASRRKGRARPLSYSLDYIGELVAKVKKLDYKHITTNLAELPYKAYKTFVFYNIMDVMVQICIEKKTNDIEYMFSKAIVNNTRYPKVHRQTIYLANRGIKEFAQDGFIMGNNVNKFNEKPNNKFPGAFVADLRRVNNDSRVRICGVPVNIFGNLNDFDYASLYPSVIRQFNVAAHTQIGMIVIDDSVCPEFENRQKDPLYSRAGQFLEDFQSHVWLELGSRWFNLSDYTALVDDVTYFFNNIAMPNYGFRIYNRDGRIDPMFIPEVKKKLPESPMYFYDDGPRNEVYMPFDIDKAEEWRKYAQANPNQQFK